MRKIWNKIKAWILGIPKDQPEGPEFFGIEWGSYDIDEIDKTLGVSREAFDKGRKGFPEINETPPDVIEGTIELAITHRFTHAREQVLQRVGALAVDVGAGQINTILRKMSEKQRNFDESVEEARVQLENTQRSELEDLKERHSRELSIKEQVLTNEQKSDRAEISSERSKRKHLRDEIDEYKKTYGVKREPNLRPARDRYTMLTGILLLAVAQASGNGFLFADASIMGATFGIGVAFIIGVLDVTIHYFLGRYGCRVKAPDRGSRIVGGLCSLVFFCTIILINLSVVHLRRISQEYPGESWSASFGESFWNNTLDIADPLLLALGLLGLVCSVSAVISGWKWNEYIPLFLEIQGQIEGIDTKTSEQNKKMSEDKIKHDQEMLEKEDAHKKQIKKLESDHTHARENIRASQANQLRSELKEGEGDAQTQVRRVEGSLTQISNLEDRLSADEDKANKAYSALVELYRAKNREGRKVSSIPGIGVPEYFNQISVLQLQPLPKLLGTAEKQVAQAKEEYEKLKQFVSRFDQELLEYIPEIQRRNRRDFFGDDGLADTGENDE